MSYDTNLYIGPFATCKGGCGPYAARRLDNKEVAACGDIYVMFPDHSDNPHTVIMHPKAVKIKDITRIDIPCTVIDPTWPMDIAELTEKLKAAYHFTVVEWQFGIVGEVI